MTITTFVLIAKILGFGTLSFVVLDILMDKRGIGYALRLRLWMSIFTLVGVLAIPISLIWLLGSLLFAPEGQRALAIILAYDRLGNATIGGDGRETISSHIGRLQTDGQVMPGWAFRVGKFLDWLQPDHCKNAIGV